MRLSKYFFHTSKEAPADAETPSHKLLERAGYIRKLGRGIYITTPLMKRVLQKIEAIVRDELDRTGCQEVTLPLLQPADLWKQTERWEGYTSEGLLYTLKDRHGHDYCMAPTCEEVMTSLVSGWVSSYKQLPIHLYQIGPKFRDEIRPRFGLMRSREFLMQDGYSFAADPEGMRAHYEEMREAYRRIFERLGLDFAIVKAHGGKIASGGDSEEFQVKADIGEDAILVCGEYAANVETAQAVPQEHVYASEQKPKEIIDTPQTTTIESLSKLTKTPPQEILKTVVYKLIFPANESFVAIGIRGDRQINEVKVGTHFGAMEIALASEEEVAKVTGSKIGFVGPLESRIPFYADNSCKPMTNFMCAYNVPDKHAKHVNFERDLPLPEFQDFLLAEAGDRCPHVEGGTYTLERGIEVGHIFNIGTKYADKLSAFFQDEGGNMRPYWMGTYGIGIGRVAAACVEQKYDEKGIVWPASIAPFQVVITAATTKNAAQVETAEKIYSELEKYEALLDDRDERIGFKLKDSDLMGIPLKIIVGRSFDENGTVEVESRQGEKQWLTPEKAVAFVKTNASP